MLDKVSDLIEALGPSGVSSVILLCVFVALFFHVASRLDPKLEKSVKTAAEIIQASAEKQRRLDPLRLDDDDFFTRDWTPSSARLALKALQRQVEKWKEKPPDEFVALLGTLSGKGNPRELVSRKIDFLEEFLNHPSSKEKKPNELNDIKTTMNQRIKTLSQLTAYRRELEEKHPDLFTDPDARHEIDILLSQARNRILGKHE